MVVITNARDILKFMEIFNNVWKMFDKEEYMLYYVKRMYK